jgi:mono/diheme cytochrome c family protein
MTTLRLPFWKRAVVVIAVAILLVLLVVVKRTSDQAPLRPGEVSLDASVASTSQGAMVERGRELAIVHCATCHGPDLSGGELQGPEEDIALAPSLARPDSAAYTEEDLFCALRHFSHPDGTPLNPIMPAVVTRTFSDEEIRCLWLYMLSK